MDNTFNIREAAWEVSVLNGKDTIDVISIHVGLAVSFSLLDFILQFLDVSEGFDKVTTRDGMKEVSGSLGKSNNVFFTRSFEVSTESSSDGTLEVTVGLGGNNIGSDGLGILDDLTEIG